MRNGLIHGTRRFPGRHVLQLLKDSPCSEQLFKQPCPSGLCKRENMLCHRKFARLSRTGHGEVKHRVRKGEATEVPSPLWSWEQGLCLQKWLLPSRLSAQTSPVQSDTLMFCLIKQKKKDWNHTWHGDTFIIYRRNVQMISSLFPQTPQIARLTRNLSRVRVPQNQRERKKK